MDFATPAADQTWFDFSLQDAPEDTEFGVYAFSGRERLNEPYLFVVELVSLADNRDMTHCLGRKARLSIRDRSGGTRQVHGFILRMEQLHTANRFTHYRCELVPAFRFLEFTQEHKIFQNLTVSQIIDQVLLKHHFPVEAYDFYLHGKYQAREYCVQYGESDLHFVSRLCEEEGISFYFDHSGDREKICFSDAWGGRHISGETSLRFYPDSGHREDTAVISRLALQRRIVSDQSTCREWDFTHPSLDMTGHDEEPDWRQAPVPPAMQLETYQFPHLYQSQAEGARYAFLQLKRQLTWSTWIEAESDASRFVPGFLFSLHGHPRQDVNRQWTIVEVEHTGKQPGALRHEAPEDRGLEYQAKVTAIPHDVRFIPGVRHPKKRINGLQSALVTGPQSEEIYCDEYGRVKVQFHWDRLGARDENTTCWIRAAGLLAGDHFGSVHLPRVGQEVMVEFMEGDPDRPVITGRWYNAAHMPPWQQPGQKTLSGVQSREFGLGRRNHIPPNVEGIKYSLSKLEQERKKINHSLSRTPNSYQQALGQQADRERLQTIERKIEELKAQLPSPGLENRKQIPLSADNIERAEQAFLTQEITEETALAGHVATLLLSVKPQGIVHTVKHPSSLWHDVYSYIPVNIHTKAMIIDDCFIIVGSANMHKRGMESDNEIDVSTADSGEAKRVREELFRQMFRGANSTIEEENVSWNKLYYTWKDILDLNWNRHYLRKKLLGTLFYLYCPTLPSFIPTMD